MVPFDWQLTLILRFLQARQADEVRPLELVFMELEASRIVIKSRPGEFAGARSGRSAISSPHGIRHRFEVRSR